MDKPSLAVRAYRHLSSRRALPATELAELLGVAPRRILELGSRHPQKFALTRRNGRKHIAAIL